MLRYAYFSDLKFGPKFLFWGSPSDMSRLREALDQVANGVSSLPLSSLPSSKSVDGSTVVLKAVPRTSGFRKTLRGQLDFDWGLDRETALQFSEMVAVLATSKRPGHQYLESIRSEDVTVMVSCDEYPDDLAP